MRLSNISEIIDTYNVCSRHGKKLMTHLTSKVIMYVLPDCCNFQLRDIFRLRCLYYLYMYSECITTWAMIWLIQAYWFACIKTYLPEEKILLSESSDV